LITDSSWRWRYTVYWAVEQHTEWHRRVGTAQ